MMKSKLNFPLFKTLTIIAICKVINIRIAEILRFFTPNAYCSLAISFIFDNQRF